MYSFHLILISSASTRCLQFLFFIVPIFGLNAPLIFPIFLKISLVFPLLSFSSIIKHCSLKKTFLSLLDTSSYFLELCLFGCTFPSPPCFSLLFVLLLSVKPPQMTTLPSCFLFPLMWFCSTFSVQYYGSLSLVLQAHC